MTVQEILKFPDSELIRVGEFVKVLVREYRDITGLDPCFCDSQLPEYVRVVRLHYKKLEDMKTIYFDGVYYKPETITEAQKEHIKKSNEIKYNQFAKQFNWEVKNEGSTKRNTAKKRSKIR